MQGWDRVRQWVAPQATYQNCLRLGGFAGLFFLVGFRDHPDPVLVMAMCAMMGLPAFWEADKKSKKDADK